MTEYLTINSDGSVVAFFGDTAVFLNIGDINLPASVAGHLSASYEALTAYGGSMVHMERDAFRQFTHTVKGAQVTHADGISDPVFDLVMAAKDALLSL